MKTFRQASQTRAGLIKVRASSLDEEARTFEVDIATDGEVDMGGYREVLLMSGLDLPAGSSFRMPLLDSHDRRSINSILGSVTDPKIDGGVVRGKATFTTDNETADRAMALIRDGHLTDFSAGYTIRDEVFVRAGNKEKIQGREYEGPVFVVTNWKLREGSLVAVGADEAAKVREATRALITKPEAPANPTTEVRQMGDTTETGREVSPATGSETLSQRVSQAVEAAVATPPADTDATGQRSAPAAPAANVDATLQLNRHNEIRQICLLANVDGQRTLDFIDSKLSADQIRAQIIAEREQRNAPIARTVVETGTDSRDKFRAAACDGFAMRCGVAVEKPAAGAEDFRGASLEALARDCVERTGKRAPRDREELFRVALSNSTPRSIRFQGTRSNVFNHSTSDFPYILADVANKSLTEGYMEAPTTYQFWTRKASLPDFKNKNVNRLSEGPDLVVVGESGEITEGKLSEAREQYALATYARILSITRQALMNDDLEAFSRIPRMMGAAARRVPNRLAYNILKNNAALADNIALFHASHANLGTAGTITVTSLAELRTKMQKQTGLQAANSAGESVVLNIMPRYLICGPDMATIAEQLIGSSVDPAKNNAVPNPFFNRLQTISDAEIANGSNAAAFNWFLAADPNAQETVEVGFLNGVDSPTLEEEMGFDVLGMRFRVYLDCGAKALDYRGLAKNAYTGS